MGTIAFESFESTFQILNPFKDFAPDDHRVEVRKDPLLGTTSVHNPFLKDKAKVFFGDNDPELLKKLVEESAKNCIFCGDFVEKSTARYPDAIIPGGRIKVGEAVLFANLFSLGKYHPVIALSKAHFLRPSEFSPELIGNGFKATRRFLDMAYDEDPSALYASVNANYLFPAGASLVHPHLQMMITTIAYSYQAQLIDASAAYFQKNGSSYFMDLVETEKMTNARYIAQKGAWHWLAAYSPMGTNEIMAVHERETDFGRLTESDISDLSDGISRVLACYEGLGHLSFNYTLYSMREGARSEGFRCLFKIINRQNLYPNYRNDDYFLQKMLHSELIILLPEDLTRKAKEYF